MLVSLTTSISILCVSPSSKVAGETVCIVYACMSYTSFARSTASQWLLRVLDSRPKGHGFKPHRCHCVVSLSKNINPSLVLVLPRKTCPFITEKLLMGRKESIKQTNNTSFAGCLCDLSVCWHNDPEYTLRSHLLMDTRDSAQSSKLNTWF